jgi:DNA adenine methylase
MRLRASVVRVKSERLRPVLKWAGGKSKLLPDILPRLPRSIETYYEPFIGGAAVFFALAAEGRFRRAVLGDTNPDLLAVYQALKSDVERVISVLRGYRHGEDEYYRIRAAKPRALPERAARIIYLNRTGYNGLYRVNRAGNFNVPFGRYVNPTICDTERLRAAARALTKVSIEQADFETLIAAAKPGDAVYLDPPYLPLSPTSSFTAYDRHAFGIAEHERLARAFTKLGRSGVCALLSNSDTAQTRALYRAHRVHTVYVARAINSKADQRGAVSEILVSAAVRATKRRYAAAPASSS